MSRAAERKAFVRGIVENPHDTVRRMVFADWLDENGEPRRAELIRVQVELEGLPAVPEQKMQCGLMGEASIRPKSYHVRRCDWCKQTRDGSIKRHNDLAARERELICSAFPKRMEGTAKAPNKDHRQLHLWAAIAAAEQWSQPWPSQPPGHFGDAAARGTIRRGFVERVETTLDAWLQHGPGLVAQHPITEVALRDKQVAEPARTIGTKWFYIYVHHTTDPAAWWLPAVFLPFAERHPGWNGSSFSREGWVNFDSPAEATRWLGDTLVAYARQEAKLPPLTLVTT